MPEHQITIGASPRHVRGSSWNGEPPPTQKHQPRHPQPEEPRPPPPPPSVCSVVHLIFQNFQWLSHLAWPADPSKNTSPQLRQTSPRYTEHSATKLACSHSGVAPSYPGNTCGSTSTKDSRDPPDPHSRLERPPPTTPVHGSSYPPSRARELPETNEHPVSAVPH